MQRTGHTTNTTMLVFLAVPVFALGMFSIYELNRTPTSAGDATFAAREATTVYLKDTILNVDIAKTPGQRARGLSGRPPLGANEGMLFVHDTSDYHSIWMKDMNFPIDILWLNEYFTVVDIRRDVSPQTYPEKFVPDYPAKYVLEVQAGFAVANNIKIGDVLHF